MPTIGIWGHGDLRDVLAGVDFLKTLDYVDGDAMGIHGTSYGGCMSMSAVGFAPGVFKAADPPCRLRRLARLRG